MIEETYWREYPHHNHVHATETAWMVCDNDEPLEDVIPELGLVGKIWCIR